MIHYKRTCQKQDAEFIREVLKIDAAVFDKEIQGTFKSLGSRYNANRESGILACHGTDLIGYLLFFPIRNNLSKRILTEDISYDDEILPGDILPDWPKREVFDVFLISIAVLPAWKNRGIGKGLMSEFFAVLNEKIQSGCRVRDLLSYAYTDSGFSTLSKSGFSNIKCVTEPKTKEAVRLMRRTIL